MLGANKLTNCLHKLQFAEKTRIHFHQIAQKKWYVFKALKYLLTWTWRQ